MNFSVTLKCAAVAAILFATFVKAEPEEKDFTPEFVAQYKAKAEAGDAEGMAIYGRALSNGWGVETNHHAAVSWLQKAAQAGNAIGQCTLGACYENGTGVEEDAAKAVEWYTKAAEQGLPRAQCNLGFCYENGEGVEKDAAKAVQWYTKAAEQGLPQAQCNLGVLYFYGKGVKKDAANAVAFFRKAAEQGDVDAQFFLGRCYHSGTGVEQNEAKAAKWYTKAAEQGDVYAQLNLGICYFDGLGVEKDGAKAVEWFSKAADQGDARAQLNLGICYLDGTGVEKDEAKAVEWFTKAAGQGDAESQFILGNCYENGTGVGQNAAKAAEWYTKAAEQGEERAKGKLAQMKRKSLTAINEQPKGPVAKLAKDMVSIPGKDYFMCKYEVTQALWESVMGENPSCFKGPDYPVEQVSNEACLKFIEKLNALPEVKNGDLVYRLPAPDEWEYACRAGTTGKYCRLADGTEISEENLGEVAWYSDNSDEKSHPVGQKKPNAFGLYDTHGNVYELTFLPKDEVYDIFGGSWFDSSAYCRNNFPGIGIETDHAGLRLSAISKNRAETERAFAENEQMTKEKMLAGKAKEALAKLAMDMVPVPDKNWSICKYEVTQALWFAVMGETPSAFIGPDLPVEKVSWDDCNRFVAKLNERPEVRASGIIYRIPTVHEWQFACRAGAAGEYCKLADGGKITEETLDEVAWYRDNSDDRTHAVGQKKPNAFGLYDMHGNVEEWTSTVSGGGRFICGGSWDKTAFFCTAGYRVLDAPDSRKNYRGLRLASDQSVPASDGLAGKTGEDKKAGNTELDKVDSNKGSAYLSEAIKYLNGDGVEKNLAKGMAFLLKAAEMGNAKAQFYLGIFHDKGIGVDKDEVKAAEWYKKAAEQGHATAQANLGACYLIGTGVEKDETKAIEWFRKAVAQGEPQAQYCLGMCYEDGWGVDQDEAKAVELYKKAAEQGFEGAKQKLADMGLNAARAKAFAKLVADMLPIPGKNFTMCKYEVTQTLWEAVMGENPSEFTGASSPVEKVSWNDCQKFLAKLNALPDVKASGITYRLPTAEEWCYACLAGGEDGYCKLADGTEITKDTIGEVANCIHNSWSGGTPSPVTPDSTNPVGRKKPNAFGLYDMHGNVAEWTSTAYQGGRLALGGSWNHLAYGCMVIPMISALGSDKKAPDYKDNTIGLRLVADKSEETAEDSAGKVEMRKESEQAQSTKTDANAGKTYLKEGMNLVEGNGVEKDVAKGMALLLKAGELGEPDAYFFLGACYFKGNGVEKDMDKVVDFWRKGAEIEKGQSRIRFMLSLILLEKGGAKNEEEAVKWLEQAVEVVNDNNIDDARFKLAGCYILGKGLPPGASRQQYEAKGRQLLAIAALRGHKDAAKALESLGEP